MGKFCIKRYKKAQHSKSIHTIQRYSTKKISVNLKAMGSRGLPTAKAKRF